MKRYWKILTVCLVTVIVLGTFYIQSSLASENIQIEFEKVSGDESLVEDLVLNANYVVGDIHQYLLISNGGTKNLMNRSVVQQLTGLYAETSTLELVEKYKQFMRGKSFLPSYFYEDEQVLVYVSIEGRGVNIAYSNAFFDIDILDKKTEESTPMKISLPKGEKYDWIDITDIQIVDRELKVIARGSGMGIGEDLIAYTIDLNSKKITSDKVVFSTPGVENGWSGMNIFNDYYSPEPQRYLLFKAEAYEHGQGEGEPKELVNDFMIYDIEKNKLVKSELPDDFAGDIANSTVLNSVAYVPVQSQHEVEVIQYDIEAQEWSTKQTFAIEQSKDAEHVPFVKLQDEKLYIVSSTDDGHKLLIGDINTGKTLYEGKLKVKNQKTAQNEYQLYVNEINIDR
ncbi:hypothetical protein DZB84_09735 [Bacillus sp. HNG]|uniref:hypothetical protein n=1 Tax=Bacillus sp. HNG TaxID=2293325 RepID=UPI000E2E98C3|nr:hypothetical protein [Bacillus sp. HNG]RFB17341.1 hypothetical protein DZB84_09735 [Bacillus sp. HNG]